MTFRLFITTRAHIRSFWLRFQTPLIFYRLSDWAHVLGISLLGFAYAFTNGSGLSGLFLCILVSSLYLSWGYSFNRYFDGPIAEESQTLFLTSIPAIGFLVISYLISDILFFLLLSGLIMNILYSAPPFLLKTKPVFDLILNSLCFTILFLIGTFSAGGGLGFNTISLGIFVGIIILPFQLVHELAHLSEDKSNNILNLAQRLGVENTLAFASLMTAMIVLVGFILWQINVINHLMLIVTLGLSITIAHNLIGLGKHRIQLDNFKGIRMRLRNVAIVYGCLVLFSFIFI